MESDNRPNPDDLLKTIKSADSLKDKGQLRLFLGMSAGVGKTFSMLRNAREQLRSGIDVVVGIVETHGRSETAQQLEGLPQIPRKRVEYRGTVIEEMDLDAILKRKPKLVIVDELAHTNAPASRHEKRYQDVVELLEAGIDVYSAMNVQHFESRKESVEAITGVRIHETVPDSLLDRASLVEIVDVAPSELLKRLKDGKIYLAERAERAAQNFFKEDKLTALREIALRITAERVDHDLRRISTTRQDEPWATNERLLVAISHSPFSENLIRATRRLAYNLEAPWIAVYVDTGLTLSDQDLAQLNKNLQLARDLNASEVLTTTDTNFPAAIQRLCRQKNVTQVVVGRPTRRWFRNFLEGGSLLENLMTQAGEVDVHIIRQDNSSKSYKPSVNNELSLYKSKTPPLYYFYTIAFIGFVTAQAALLQNYLGYRAVGFIYLITVMVVGIFGSIGSVILAATGSAFIWNFFFIPPRFTFIIDKPEDIILIFSYFFVALITGSLTYRIRFQERLLREREEKTHFLYEILKDIANSREKSEFLKKVLSRLNAMMEANCYVILKNEKGSLNFINVQIDEKKQAVALWSFENSKPAGWSTDTLSESEELYLPLKGSFENMGVFVFKPTNTLRKLKLDQENLLISVVDQLGLSIEKHYMSKKINDAQLLKDSEQLHQTLLNTVSHEIRTPLTVIRGAAGLLEDGKVFSDGSTLKEVIEDLKDASERLNQVVENLLDMSKLNSGYAHLNMDWHDLNDMIVQTKKKLTKILKNHDFSYSIDDNAQLIKVDFKLFEHAITNLILNSCYYTPEGSQIRLEALAIGNQIQISVSDNGDGVPESEVPKIFEKFYRASNSRAGGIGLGLSLVRSIIKLHKGDVCYEKNVPQGAKFIISIPYEAPKTENLI